MADLRRRTAARSDGVAGRERTRSVGDRRCCSCAGVERELGAPTWCAALVAARPASTSRSLAWRTIVAVGSVDLQGDRDLAGEACDGVAVGLDSELVARRAGRSGGSACRDGSSGPKRTRPARDHTQGSADSDRYTNGPGRYRRCPARASTGADDGDSRNKRPDHRSHPAAGAAGRRDASALDARGPAHVGGRSRPADRVRPRALDAGDPPRRTPPSTGCRARSRARGAP